MTNCPKCDSNKIKKTGPFARRKGEGQKYQNQPEDVHYVCLGCKHT